MSASLRHQTILSPSTVNPVKSRLSRRAELPVERLKHSHGQQPQLYLLMELDHRPNGNEKDGASRQGTCSAQQQKSYLSFSAFSGIYLRYSIPQISPKNLIKAPLYFPSMAKKDMNEEELQQKYHHFKQIQEHLEQLSQQAELMNERNAELAVTKESLEEIKTTKEKTEILAPLADGIFMKVELRDRENLLVNIGADTVVVKTVDEVIGLIEEQKKELSLKIVQLESIMQEMQGQALAIYQQVEQHLEK